MSRGRPWPLALRLSLGLTVLAAIVLAAAGLTVTIALRGFLYERLDQQVVALTEAAHSVLSEEGEARDEDVKRTLPAGAVAVEFEDGAVTVAAAGTGAVVVAPEAVVATTVRADPTLPYTADLGGEPYRLAVDADGDEARTVAGLPLRPVEETLARLVVIELLVGLLALLAVGLGGFGVVRSGVRPLRRMSDEARRIAAADLSAPTTDAPAPPLALQLHESGGSAEVADLSASLQAMLGHIDASMAARAAAEQRLRQFVADASHELRTPLASIRGYAELGRRGMTGDAESSALAARRIEDEAARMGVLVDDLLLLARLDQGRPLEREPVDLAVVARDSCADLRAASPEREVSLELDDRALNGDALVVGDDGRLRQVLANLLANARHHTPPDSPVRVGVRRDGETVVVEVQDHGTGIAPVEQERVFERFYRVDAGRSRDQGGSGLGLSIVDSVVRAHAGQVSLRSGPSGTTVRVELPAAP